MLGRYGLRKEAEKIVDQFWPTDAQVAKIAPHLRANCFSPFLYRSRNAIKRMFRRLTDFRRVCIAASVSYWLAVWTLNGRATKRFT